MHDVNFLRTNLEAVRAKLGQRNFPLAALDSFVALDERRRTLIRESEDLKAARNRESQEIGKLMKAGQKEEAEKRGAAVRKMGERTPAIEADLAAVENELNGLLATLPNLPHERVPVGNHESDNQVVTHC